MLKNQIELSQNIKGEILSLNNLIHLNNYEFLKVKIQENYVLSMIEIIYKPINFLKFQRQVFDYENLLKDIELQTEDETLLKKINKILNFI